MPAPTQLIHVQLTHMSPLSRAAVKLADMIVAWEVRYRSRKHLDRLDDRLLKDIGLDTHTANQEVHKPFWQD